MSVSINGAGSITGIDQGFNVTTGSVGIGTDNPTQKLELLSTGNTIIKLGGASANTTGIIINRGGSEVSRIAHANSDDLSFYTTSSVTERLRITSAGKVGIGTDDPKQFLSVVGRATFDQAGDYYGAWINGNSTADSSFNVGAWYNVGGRLRDNGNHVVLESMNTSHYVQLQPSGGNVGVGENGPNAKLHVTKDNDVAYTPSQATQDSNNQIKIENHSTTTDSFVSMAMRARACDFHLGVKNNGADNSGRLFLVHQDTTNKEVVSVLSTGNVGIGTDDPSWGVSTGLIVGDGASAKGITIFSNSANVGDLAFADATSGTARYRGLIRYDHSDDSLTLRTNSSERLRISSDGKVCVGTTLTNYGVLQIRDASGDSTTSAIQVENASSGSNTTNVISRSVSLNSGAWANAEYRAKSHIFSYQTTPVATIQQHGLTVASQPCFWATSNTGGSHTSNGYTGIISDQLEAAYVNIGNHFNTSTGVFTCPVAGTYEFHGQGLIRWQGAAGRSELTFYKNGSNTVSRSYGYTWVSGSSDHDNLLVMAYITCAANDQIDLRVYAMDSQVDCYFAQGLGYFAGRLVQ